MDNSILIVGASGFIGGALSNLLSNKYKITSTSSSFSNKNFHYLNFNDPNSFSKFEDFNFDYVIVLAALISDLDNKDIASKAFDTNVCKSAQFIDWLKKAKISNKVIFLSSMTVYTEQNYQVDEKSDTQFPPHSYGFSKKLNEELIKYAFTNSEIQYVIFRIPGVFDVSKRNGFIFTMYSKLKNNENIIIDPKSSIYWETIYLPDLSNLLLQFLENWPIHNETINIGYGKFQSMEEIVYLLKKELDSTSNIEVKSEQCRLNMDNSKFNNLIPISFTFESALIDYLIKIK